MDATNNANQKEKFEADLKKEIKKLQVEFHWSWLNCQGSYLISSLVVLIDYMP